MSFSISRNVTYSYALPPPARQSPLLSDRPLPPAPYNPYNPYGYDEGPLDQYRSTQFQSPTFSEPASEASTTVSPRDVFADSEIAHRTYPSLFPSNIRASTFNPSVGTHSPRTPVDEATSFAQPSRLSGLRQESTDSHASYSSYASTSSEDEDAIAPHPLLIPEPAKLNYSHAYQHVRSASNNHNSTTLSPSLACLATSPKRNGHMEGGKTTMQFGFRPLEPENRIEQDLMSGGDSESEYEGGERVSSPATANGEEVVRIAPVKIQVGGFKKRPSPFGDEDEENSAYHSSASDDDEDEYVERPKARRTSSASQAPQQPKPKKKRVDNRNNRGPSVAAPASSSATPVREGSVRASSPEATCWCAVPGCPDTKGFVRTYDLKRVSLKDLHLLTFDASRLRSLTLLLPLFSFSLP